MTEVESFLAGMNRRSREGWEQTRLLGFIIAQVNSSKSLKQTDILRFPWDTKEDDAREIVSDEDMNRLREMARNVERQWKGEKENGD